MQTQEHIREMTATRDSDYECSGEAIRKNSAAIEHAVSHLRAEAAARVEESNRCDVEIREIRRRLSDVQAECDDARRFTAPPLHHFLILILIFSPCWNI
jgi:hypothetical protein